MENTPAQYTTLDINLTTSGALTLVPILTDGWFADGDAPLVFNLWDDDFSLETEVFADSAQDPGQPPGSDFNSAGLMARNPTGATEPENHVMVNIGRQDATIESATGSEVKSTRNANSQLQLQSGSHRGRLILCRTGARFTAFRLLDNETEWTEIGAVVREDLPESLQLGLVVNGFSGPDLGATINYVRVHAPLSQDDCIRQ